MGEFRHMVHHLHAAGIEVILETAEETAEAVGRVAALDRAHMRDTFERHFSAEIMAMGYEAAYRAVRGMADEVRASRLRPAHQGVAP
jgi:hypothetical protein